MYRGNTIVKEKSIRRKLNLGVSLLLIAVCIMLGLIFNFKAKTMVNNTIEILMPQIIDQGSKNIEANLNSTLGLLSLVSSEINIEEGMKDITKNKDILSNLKNNGDFINVGIADIKGEIVLSDGKKSNISDREYFKQGIKGKSYISSLLKDKVTNERIIVFSVPVKDNSSVNGILVGIKSENQVNDIIKATKVGKTGKAFVIDSEGITVSHFDSEKVGDNLLKNSPSKELTEIITRMTKGEEGIGRYTYNKESKIVAFSHIKNTDTSLAITMDEDEVLGGLKEFRLITIISTVIVFILSLGVIYIISISIIKGILVVQNNLRTMERGNLNIKNDESIINRNDEIGRINRALNDMNKSIKDIILNIKENCGSITGEASSLASVSEELSASTENVSLAIQQVAQGTSKQAEDLTYIIGNFSEFGDQIEKMVYKIQNIRNKNSEASSLVKNCSGDIKEVMNSLKGLVDSFNNLDKNIVDLNSNMDKVNEITKFINKIADQTNLLALNAAIEAARAGQAGTGFAVVAEEIRKLAEQSKESSTNINNIIRVVLKETTTMVKTTHDVNSEIIEQQKSIKQALKSFNEIQGALEVIVNEVEEVDKGSEKIIKNKNFIIDRTESISAIAEEVSASSQEIAASSEQMAASILEVSSAAQKLEGNTENMLNITQKFDI